MLTNSLVAIRAQRIIAVRRDILDVVNGVIGQLLRARRISWLQTPVAPQHALYVADSDSDFAAAVQQLRAALPDPTDFVLI